jgi:TPR repeat protein
VSKASYLADLRSYAETGDVRAGIQLALGLLKYSENGPRGDAGRAEGEACLRVAAENDREAQFILATMLGQGVYLPKDESEAKRFLELSAEQGYRPAVLARQRLKENPDVGVGGIDPAELIGRLTGRTTFHKLFMA